MAMVSVTTKPYLASDSRFRMLIETIDHYYRFGALVAPVEITYSNVGRVWTEVPRPGKVPYLVTEAYKIPKLSFTMQLADQNIPDRDLTGGLKQLGYMASTPRPIRIIYGGYWDTRIWRMTNFDFVSKRRHPTTDAITWAEVNCEFTMANDVVLSLGPTTGGVR